MIFGYVIMYIFTLRDCALALRAARLCVNVTRGDEVLGELR